MDSRRLCVIGFLLVAPLAISSCFPGCEDDHTTVYVPDRLGPDYAVLPRQYCESVCPEDYQSASSFYCYSTAGDAGPPFAVTCRCCNLRQGCYEH